MTPALASVGNAVVDALADLGVEHVELPATPERVWNAIRAARRPARPRWRPLTKPEVGGEGGGGAGWRPEGEAHGHKLGPLRVRPRTQTKPLGPIPRAGGVSLKGPTRSRSGARGPSPRDTLSRDPLRHSRGHEIDWLWLRR